MNNIDASSDQFSEAIDCQEVTFISAQATFSSATLGGTFKLQASNDPSIAGNLAGQFTPTNWTDIPVTTAIATVASGATTIIYVSQFAYKWIRVVWINSAGTGNILVNIAASG